jgi:enolase
MVTISDLKPKVIQDSRDEPTLEIELISSMGHKASASVPTGKSRGLHEAVPIKAELAVENLEHIIKPKIIGMDVFNQPKLDLTLNELDGTPNKSKLGANSILAVSLATSRLAALAQKIPLYLYLNQTFFDNPIEQMPIPVLNIINGGKHANNNLTIQEFLILPLTFTEFIQKIEVGKKILIALNKILIDQNLINKVGDEGGYAPNLPNNTYALELILSAIEKAGFYSGHQIGLGMDVAASSLPPDTKITIQQYIDICQKYPITFLEDPIEEDQWDQWAQLKLELENNNCYINLVGDDLFVTNPERLQKGINHLVANTILIKLNQIGTLTETIDVVKIAKKNNFECVISHRSGETMDDYIADFTVASGAKFIKSGAPNNTKPERMVKYNRLVEIEQEIKEGGNEEKTT